MLYTYKDIILFNLILIMTSLVKKSFYTTVWLASFSLNTVFAVDAGGIFWNTKVTVGGENRNIETAVQSYIEQFSLYLSLIAVAYALWWGFNILTAAWDEEKVKTGKTIIIHALIWLLVIFIAKLIINTFLNLLA